ncbi:ankyrin repeat domain-containing protein [Streptomyces sp. NBC_00882]|uniref:ankyrin repeat domain-containing protein n=1 Tax=Streptomyces sp. NBC_00882 TaxID=2975856 RepID=UPI0038653B9F|nr:ankyrin repeat domain-containing protein [Streptomyces sp. NBC_00882]WSZ36915.1 ankyrin repeat domain-containing protein [Streptomyces sp. NBC_00882]
MSEREGSGVDRLGRSALHYAAASGDLAAVRAAVDAGADVHAGDSAGWTPLHFAAQSQSADIAIELLTGHSLVDAVDVQGNTPLWRAVFNYRGDPAVLEVLREAGADPDRVNAHGVSPRQLAERIANYDVARHVNW